MKSFWLSWGLLVLAYATFGQWLHGDGAEALVWWVTLAFVVLAAGGLTLIWQSVRQLVLMGFQSDVGYAVMVLLLASSAVLAVVQFRAFAYVVVLAAASILVKVDCLIQDLGDRLSFVVLLILPIIGLGLSWAPHLLPLGLELAR